MKVSSSKQDNVFVIALSGRIMGGEGTDDFYQVISIALEEGFRNFVLDLQDVEWMNSTGLGMVIAGSARVRDIDGIFKLARPNDSVSQALAINRLNLVFEIHPTLEAAVASFN
ncbi:MAG: STAS domain-containing protein [Calditrichota bacterium]